MLFLLIICFYNFCEDFIEISLTCIISNSYPIPSVDTCTKGSEPLIKILDSHLLKTWQLK